ncbi:uncharacterized protein LOC127094710 [Lathyrus oleraceus]|uniref:uncharacterized protein LOC127094710 n=1 Tax=Pisum sativum TaxID=3888 RepID=UPI0021D227B9|nr:uncharacterized protein LOC127094710 [Pisum sativum]
MKENLTKKRRYTDEETIHLGASCCAIIQRALPQKEKDHGRVTLPITIGNVNVRKALIYLSSNIKLLSLSVIKQIGNLDMKHKKMTLQIAEKSITRLSGITKDILVKVDKFMFSIDFMVMNIEANDEVTLNLGQSFTKTTILMVDVDDGLMNVIVQDEEVNFSLFEEIKHPNNKGVCFKIDADDEGSIYIRKQTGEKNKNKRRLGSV